MLDLWRSLVKLESPSHYKKGVDAVAAVIEEFCRINLGYFIRYQKDDVYGNCLAACSCPFEEYNSGVVISSHMDTVHALGAFDPVLREDEHYLYGPGAGDCKGGIVMSLLVAMALKKFYNGARPIKLLFAADEESGGPTGTVFYPNELKGSDYMFNAESGIRGKLVTGRKSSIIATYEISGVAAHVGYLQGKPISAIREAAMKLVALEDASDYDNLVFSGGVIKGGRIATSVPESCTLEVNVRIKAASYADKALEILRNANTPFVEGTSSKLSVRGNISPMQEQPQNIDLCKKMSEISSSLGFGSFESCFVGGASDAAYASAEGIPVVCASGPIVDFQHTLQERVLKKSMVQRAIIHTLTIMDL